MRKNKIFKFVVFDAIRSKLIAGYSLLFLILGFSIFYLGQDVSKSLVSLMNVSLLIVPLVSIILGTIHYYNSREFMEMLLTQPIRRKTIFWGEYWGIATSLALSFIIGIGIPMFCYGISISGLFILLIGALLTYVFVALAFLVSVINNDKSKGIGTAILVWFYFSVIYDGLILLVLFLFSDYPLDKAVIIMTALNPIDTGRIAVMLKMDISALMGVTGALFHQIFGTVQGVILSFAILFCWLGIPATFAWRAFRKKDF